MKERSFKDYLTSPTRYKRKQRQLAADPFSGSRSICDKTIRLFDDLILSKDFENRPLYVCPDGHVFLETFSKFYKPAYEFMISIAEPVSRPQYIQEYQITTYSLYSAVSIGLDADEIIRFLSLFSKCKIHDDLKKLITDTIITAGKVKLILKNKRYFVQSSELSLLQFMYNELTDYIVLERNENDIYDEENGFIIPNLELEQSVSSIDIMEEIAGFKDDLDIMEDDEDIEIEEGIDSKHRENIRRFEIKEENFRDVRKKALSLNIPFTDEYDYNSDVTNDELKISLRNTTSVRPYQEKALSKMFGGSRAKSGIIVLPCGAGKTLVGITAACTIRKSTIIFCDTNLPVSQWYDQIIKYTTIDQTKIVIFNSKNKTDIPAGPCIVITTYSIFNSGKCKRTNNVVEQICSKEWGLMIMDEVQSMVCDSFARVNDKIKAHAKLGLTATLVREDDRIYDLNYLIGPRLYEADWIDLSNQGYIARVKCYEVWCKMTGKFYKQYMKSDIQLGRILSSINPNKFNSIERLIRYHESRGDKILVFADILDVLNLYGNKLARSEERRFRPTLQGCTKDDERRRIFNEFKNSDKVNTIFISSIGDKAIDLPDANVLIQICSHFGARMQEAQRLGRILRKKPGMAGEFNAFFYTIISEDTREMYFSRKRQQFLTNQGYVYEVVQECDNVEKKWPVRGNMMYETKEKQKDLFNECLSLKGIIGEGIDEKEEEEEEEIGEKNKNDENDDDYDDEEKSDTRSLFSKPLLEFKNI